MNNCGAFPTGCFPSCLQKTTHMPGWKDRSCHENPVSAIPSIMCHAPLDAFGTSAPNLELSVAWKRVHCSPVAPRFPAIWKERDGSVYHVFKNRNIIFSSFDASGTRAKPIKGSSSRNPVWTRVAYILQQREEQDDAKSFIVVQLSFFPILCLTRCPDSNICSLHITADKRCLNIESWCPKGLDREEGCISPADPPL